jgi:hypothetical protein
MDIFVEDIYRQSTDCCASAMKYCQQTIINISQTQYS